MICFNSMFMDLSSDERGGVCMFDIFKQHDFRNRVWLGDLKSVVRHDREAKYTIYHDACWQLRIKANQGHGRTVGANGDDTVALPEIQTAIEVTRNGFA